MPGVKSPIYISKVCVKNTSRRPFVLELNGILNGTNVSTNCNIPPISDGNKCCDYTYTPSGDTASYVVPVESLTLNKESCTNSCTIFSVASVTTTNSSSTVAVFETSNSNFLTISGVEYLYLDITGTKNKVSVGASVSSD